MEPSRRAGGEIGQRRGHANRGGGDDGALSIWEYGSMKTTIELPDAVFRQAKALAVARGAALKRFFTEALEARPLRRKGDGRAGREGPPWMAGFGALSDLADEHRRVLGVIEEEFEKPAPEDRP